MGREMGCRAVKLEQGRVSSSELIYMVVGFTVGSTVVYLPGIAAGRATWLAIIVGAVEGLALVAIYMVLASRFERSNLVDISAQVFGPILGRLISLIFLWFCYHLGTLVLRNFTDAVSALILPQTPALAVKIMVIVVCGYAARAGIETIARSVQVVVLLYIATVAALLVLSLSVSRVEYLFPLFDMPMGKFLWAAHQVATFPLGETVLFLMVVPFVNIQSQIRSAWLKGLLIALVLLVSSALRSVLSLGESINVYAFASFQSVRLINIGKFLTRIEIIVIINALTMIFAKLALLYYGVVLGLAQIFRLQSYKTLIAPVGGLIIFLSEIDLHSYTAIVTFGNEVYPLYSLFFELGIPVLLLVTALIRKLPKGVKNRCAKP